MTFGPTAQDFLLEIMFGCTTQLVEKDVTQSCSKTDIDFI